MISVHSRLLVDTLYKSTNGKPVVKKNYSILIRSSTSVMWACADNGVVSTETSSQCNSCRTGRTLGAGAPNQDNLYSKTIAVHDSKIHTV